MIELNAVCQSTRQGISTKETLSFPNMEKANAYLSDNGFTKVSETTYGKVWKEWVITVNVVERI